MSLLTAPQTRVHIRWMIPTEMPAVMAIENANSIYPWSEQEFLRVLRQRNAIGMVGEHGSKVVGFMIYEIHRTKIQVLDFGVDPKSCRRGVGRQMIEKLIGKLSTQRRSTLEFMVRETNLAGQLFLRACGLIAESVEREHFPDSGEDGYRFTHLLRDPVPTVNGSVDDVTARLTEGWA